MTTLQGLARKTFVVCAMVISGLGQATTLTLPAPNSYMGQTFNGFNAYSLDLLDKCKATDPRCQPTTGSFPVDANTGSLFPQLLVITNQTNPNSNNTPLPLPGGTAVDNPLKSPSGGQATTFPSPPTYGTDPAGQFAGDQLNTWEIKLSALQAYLGAHELVFLFDNSQEGSNSNQNIAIWAQARIIDTSGATQGTQCWELSLGSGCGTTSPLPSSYLPVLGSLCVANDGSYNTIGASSQGDCPSGSIYVSNNISGSNAEYAAFSQSLNSAVKGGDGDLLLSIDVRFFGNNGGAEQLWICNACDVTEQRTIPEPSSLALLALGFLGLLGARSGTRAAAARPRR